MPLDRLAELTAERKRLQEEVQVLANKTLPGLNQEKRGVLQVVVRGVRNVGGAEGEEAEGAAQTVSVAVEPASIVEEREARVELQGVGESAEFAVASLEAKVTIRFGEGGQHVVHVPLYNKYKDAELAQLSDWHTSSRGEDTETPQITDVTAVPQVQLLFKYTRANKAELKSQTDRLRELQDNINAIANKENSLRALSPTSPDKGKAGSRGPLSLSRVLSLPFEVLPKWGAALAGTIWKRRAYVVWAGGVVVFHFFGDDLAL